MRREKLVNDAAWRGVENLDSAGLMAVNDAVLADAQPPQPFKVPLEGLYVAKSCRQTEDRGLYPPTGLRRKRPLVVAHLIRHRNFSRQAKKRDGI